MAAAREKCRSCGAEIAWLVHDRTGKPAPIEVTPRPDGNVVVLSDGGLCRMEIATRYRVLTKAEKEEMDAGRFPGLPRYVSHFVSCADAPHWRDRETELAGGAS